MFIFMSCDAVIIPYNPNSKTEKRNHWITAANNVKTASVCILVLWTFNKSKLPLLNKLMTLESRSDCDSSIIP